MQCSTHTHPYVDYINTCVTHTIKVKMESTKILCQGSTSTIKWEVKLINNAKKCKTVSTHQTKPEQSSSTDS